MSKVNTEYGHVFVHVPKTAGVSMEVMPFVGGTGHLNLHFCTLEPDFDESLIRWGFVRNPYHRIASAYFYVRQKQPKEFRKRVYDPDYSFESFVMNIERSIRNDVWDEKKPQDHSTLIHLYPQTYFLKSDNYAMDFVGRYENLYYQWQEIAKQISLKNGVNNNKWLHLKHKNKTFNKPDYATVYNPDMMDKIYDIYREDFETFNYPR